MKKLTTSRLFALILAMALPFWLSSCGDDNNTPTPSIVEGSWKVSRYTVSPAADLLQDGKPGSDVLAMLGSINSGSVTCLTNSVVTFNNTNKVTVKAGKCTATTNINPIADNATWKLEGSKLTVTSGTTVKTYDATASGNTLKMSFPKSEDLDGDGKQESYTYTYELTKA